MKTLVAVLLLMWSCERNVQAECPTIISREEWKAVEPTEVKPLAEDPPPYVVVHHSATQLCNSTANCTKQVQNIQKFHMVDNKFEDIGYHFLIGGNGDIFEGRGWGVHGAHAPVMNRRSIGICLIGNFMDISPPDPQIDALKDLIACGVEKNKIKSDYKLIGHRQVRATLCPGKNLYNLIKTWDHYEKNPST